MHIAFKFKSFFKFFLNSKLLAITLSAKFKTNLKIILLKIFLDHPIGAVLDLTITLTENIFHTRIQ